MNDNSQPIGLATVLDGVVRRPGNTYSANYIGLVRDDQGGTSQALIKDLPIGDLVRELIGASIAVTSKITMPRSFLAVVDEAAIETGHGPMLDVKRRLVFASQLLRGDQVATLLARPLPARILDALIAWKELPWLFAFDTWLANVDRHAGNILMRSATEFCAIDHGHCFNGPKTVRRQII